jgi:hypothetical protein
MLRVTGRLSTTTPPSMAAPVEDHGPEGPAWDSYPLSTAPARVAVAAALSGNFQY